MTTARSALDRIGDGKYVLLTTYRKDGTPVPTPVWVVRYEDGQIAVWTATATAKVKRIRRNRDVTVASCTFRGRPTGEPVAARAEILDTEGTQRVRDLIKKKFWLTGPLTVNLSLRRRGPEGSVGIRIAPAA
jgi:uncharacterized protein